MDGDFYQPRLLVKTSVSSPLRYSFANPATEPLHCLFQDCKPAELAAATVMDPSENGGSPKTYGLWVPVVGDQASLDQHFGRMTLGADSLYLFFKAEGGRTWLCTCSDLSNGFVNNKAVHAASKKGDVLIGTEYFPRTSLLVTTTTGGLVIIGVIDSAVF